MCLPLLSCKLWIIHLLTLLGYQYFDRAVVWCKMLAQLTVRLGLIWMRNRSMLLTCNSMKPHFTYFSWYFHCLQLVYCHSGHVLARQCTQWRHVCYCCPFIFCLHVPHRLIQIHVMLPRGNCSCHPQIAPGRWVTCRCSADWADIHL